MSLRERIQQALAGRPVEPIERAAKVGEGTLRRVLSGRTKTSMRIDTVEALAGALGADPAWLAGWDDGQR